MARARRELVIALEQDNDPIVRPRLVRDCQCHSVEATAASRVDESAIARAARRQLLAVVTRATFIDFERDEALYLAQFRTDVAVSREDGLRVRVASPSRGRGPFQRAIDGRRQSLSSCLQPSAGYCLR